MSEVLSLNAGDTLDGKNVRMVVKTSYGMDHTEKSLWQEDVWEGLITFVSEQPSLFLVPTWQFTQNKFAPDSRRYPGDQDMERTVYLGENQVKALIHTLVRVRNNK